MGWCEGSEFAERFINVCKKYVSNEKERKSLYEDYFDFLCSKDWDTQNENMGQDPVWDKIVEDFYMNSLFYSKEEMEEELYGGKR